MTAADPFQFVAVGPDDPTWRCPNCGATFESDPYACTNCGRLGVERV
ncbi:MAG: hypothetical protein ABEJ82_09510 [Haloplanus sp.]